MSLDPHNPQSSAHLRGADHPTAVDAPDVASHHESAAVTPPAPVVRALVTGAGGPAAIGFIQLADRPDVAMYAADMDPYASGLYLVPPDRRALVPRGDAPEFVDAVLDLCVRENITILVPTVDAELLPLARRGHDLDAAGITVLSSSVASLEACLDKAELAALCHQSKVRCPATEIITETTEIPLGHIVKPRSGSGSRGVRLIETSDDVIGVPRDGSFILQEALPGDELSVDVYVRRDGVVAAAVPRTRDRIDSGVAVAGRTVHDGEAIQLATAAARLLGVRGVANVQLKRSVAGTLALLEINPRLPGSLVLTAAAGANLAEYALAEALGEPIPPTVPFREVGMVRYLTDIPVEIDEYAAIIEKVSIS